MRNHEISKILMEAGVKEHWLWDKPRPKWKDFDFMVLDKIKNGIVIQKKKWESEFSIDRKIERISDGKLYDSVKLAALDNNVNINKIYKNCNELKEYRYIYEKKV